MSGFTNPDGSGLVGGQLPSGAGKALQQDASGNLLVNVAVGGGGGGGSVVNIADPNTPANKLKVNADGSINTSGGGVASSVAINDGSTPSQKLAVDASGRLTLVPNQSVNITQIGGVAAQMATANGVSYASMLEHALGLDNGATLDKLTGLNGAATIQDWVRYLILKGQSFSTTTGKQSAGAASTVGLSLFNAAASGKNVLVYSIRIAQGGSGVHILNATTSDPALGTAATVTNNKVGGAASAIASGCSFSNTNITTPAGSTIDGISNGANTTVEVLSAGSAILLPSGAANGVAIYLSLPAANPWFATMKWLEF